MSKKSNRLFLGIISAVVVLALLSVGIYYGFTQQSIVSFDEGYEPYGESQNTITGILPVNSIQDVNIKYFTDEYGFERIYGEKTGKYWKLTIGDNLKQFSLSSPSYIISGNDFAITLSPSMWQSGPSTYFSSIESTYDFSDKDFKTNIIFPGNCKNRLSSLPIGSFVIIYISHDGIDEEIMSDTSTSYDKNLLEINSDPILNKIYVYYNGEKVKELQKPLSFKIKITTKSNYEINSCSVIIQNPSWRELYGCSINPDEQYYTKIFNEGEKVGLSSLDSFTKFCIQNNPIEILTNAGSSTNTELTSELVDDKIYTVPKGQIWRINYIGEKENLATICEQDETYYVNQKKCFATTSLKITYGETEIDLQTSEVEYKLPDISTHQSLENDRKVMFSHIYNKDSYNLIEQEINLGGNTFISKGLKDSKTAIFSYKNTNYELSEGNTLELDNLFKVTASNIEENNNLERFKIDYVFSLSTIDLIKFSYENNKFILNNNYNSFEGGITITSTDILDSTRIYSKELTINKGINYLDVDLTNIREIKIRPFIKIESNDYEYQIELNDAIKSKVELESSGNYNVIIEEINYKLIIIVAGIFLAVILISVIVAFSLMKKRTHRRK